MKIYYQRITNISYSSLESHFSYACAITSRYMRSRLNTVKKKSSLAINISRDLSKREKLEYVDGNVRKFSRVKRRDFFFLFFFHRFQVVLNVSRIIGHIGVEKWIHFDSKSITNAFTFFTCQVTCEGLYVGIIQKKKKTKGENK